MTNIGFTYQQAGNETLREKKQRENVFFSDEIKLLPKKTSEITETKQNKPVLSTRISRWSTDDMLLKVRRLKDADGVAKGAFYLFILSSRFHLKHRRDFIRS